MTGVRYRLVLVCVSMALCGAAAFSFLAGDWTVRCPETQAVGWMDCAGQPDAQWRSGAFPDWMRPELLTTMGVVGVAGLFLAVGLELRFGRRRPVSEADATS